MTTLYVPDKLMVCSQDGRVVRVPADGSPPTDISPTQEQRAALTSVIKPVIDPWDPRRIVLMGTTGILVCQDSTASTVTWQTVQSLSGYTAVAVAANNSTGVNTGITVSAGDPLLITAHGTWSYGTVGPSYVYTGPDGDPSRLDSGAVLPAVFVSTLIGRIGAGAWLPVGSLHASLAGANGVLYLMMNDAVGLYGNNLGSVTAKIGTTANLADLYACPHREGYFGWLSLSRPPGGPYYVYYNFTIDLFNTTASVQVARYSPTMVYGITAAPFRASASDVQPIWVTAGDPAQGDAAIYESRDWGGNFQRLPTPSIGSNGGALWLSRGLPNGARDATYRNLVVLRSVDSSGTLSTSGLQSATATVSGVGGAPSSSALHVHDFDAQFISVAVRQGATWTLLTSDNGGTSWSTRALSLATGQDARMLTGYRGSSAYLLLAGKEILRTSTDRGQTWTNRWTSFASWADGAWGAGSWNRTLVAALVGAPSRFNHNPAGEGSCPIDHLGSATAKSRNPVDLQNGDKYEATTDLSLTTPAGTLAFTRSYRQSQQSDSRYQFMGLGWTHSHRLLLVPVPGTPNRIIVHMPNGSAVHFTETSGGHYEGDAGSTAFIDWDGGTSRYTLRASDKSTYVFQDVNSDGAFEIISRAWPSTETWTYTYASGKLAEVTDGYGRKFQFSYRNTPGQYDHEQLWRVGDQTASGLATGSPIGRYVELGYVPQQSNGAPIGSPKALLASVKDVRGQTWTYAYFGAQSGQTDANKLDKLVAFLSPSVDTSGDGTPDGALTRESLAYTYSGSALTALTQGRGKVGANPPLLETAFAFGASETTETVAGQASTHRFAYTLYQGSADPAGNSTAQSHGFHYRPEVSRDPNGGATLLQWSGNGLQLEGVRDALGYRTQFDYNVGGASADTLNFSLDAEGRKTQYLYGDANHPRLPTEVQVVDVDGTTVLRWQKFSYDSKGRTLFERTVDPANGTTVQHEVERVYYTNGNGNGLLEKLIRKDLVNPANDTTTTYSYDSAGRVVKTQQSATFGACTISYTVYDAVGNVVASLCNYDPGLSADPTTAAEAVALFNPALPDKNKVTAYAYDSLGRRVQTTTDAGASYAQTTLTVYDALDRVIRTITNYQPDTSVPHPYTAERSAFQRGPDDTWNLITETAYNQRGQVKKQIDVLGAVTLYGYDDAGRLIQTLQSASLLDYNNDYGDGGDPTLSSYPASDAPDQDILTRNQYDAVGNLVKTIDPVGNVSFTVYDALNRPVKTVRNAKSAATIDVDYGDAGYQAVNDPRADAYEADPAADRDLIELTEYDTMGRVIRTRDALDSWTLYGYDALGRQVRVIRAASVPTYDLDTDPVLSNYPLSETITIPDVDSVTDTAYDTFGRVMYTQDVLGRRTWYAYDGLGRVVRTVVNAVGTATDGGAQDPRSDNYHVTISSSDVDRVSLTTYDNDGRVMYTTNTLGLKTWQAYDELGRPVKTVINAVGMATDGSPNDPRSPVYLVSSSPDMDILARTEYDERGRVKATEDTAGNQTRYVYDAQGRRVKTIANFVTGIYNPAHPDQDLISTTVYDRAGRVLETTDARGTKTAFTYDGAGRQLTVTQAADSPLAMTSYTCYDKAGRVLRTIQNWLDDPTQPSPDDRDTQGNWLFVPTAHGLHNDQNLITVYTLDALGRQTAVADPLGNTTTLTCDKDGQVESILDPEGMISAYRYDRLRRQTLVAQGYTPSTFTDPAHWRWDVALARWVDGNGVTVKDPGVNNGAPTDQNVIVQAEYDKAGRMTALRDPRGNRTTYTYDFLDRRTSLTNPLGHRWTTAFSEVGNGTTRAVLTNPDPLNYQTQQDFDRMGRLTNLLYLNESPKDTPDVIFRYDKRGVRLAMDETVTGGASFVRKTGYRYDRARRLIGVDFDKDGNGVTDQTVSYQYEAGGLRTQLTLPDGKTIAYAYDARGQLLSLTDWSSQGTQYAYDNLGRLIATLRSNGLHTRYQHDAAGRLRLARHSKAGKVFGHFAYEVDRRGNRVQLHELTPRVASVPPSPAYFDPNSSAISYRGSWTVEGAYQKTTSGGASMQFAFFGTEATLTMGQGPDHSLYDLYLDGSLWESIDGYADTPGDRVFTLALDGEGPHGIEIRNTHNKNRRATTANYVLRFRSLGIVTGPEYDMQTIRYTYDALSRLIDARYYPAANTTLADGSLPRRHQYTYDLSGNRLQDIFSVTGLPFPTSYTYDAANRLQTQHDPGGSTRTFTHDNAGRMTADGTFPRTWDRANRLLNTEATTRVYNGLGQRVKETSGADIYEYLLDVQPGLWQVLAETLNGTSQKYFVHGPVGIQQQQNPGGAWRWTIQDALGTVRGTVDSVPLTLENRLFTPYGIRYSSTGTSQTNFDFTGEMLDNGLLDLRARHYNPMLGVFMTLDPLEGEKGSAMSLNRYMYVEGNVTNNIDPSGLLFWSYPSSSRKKRESWDYNQTNYPAHAWIERWLEQENGFWTSHLEFPGGFQNRKIDAVIFDNPSPMTQSPVYAQAGGSEGFVYEIEPAYPDAIIEGIGELNTKHRELSMSIPPFTHRGNLPLRDYWDLPKPRPLSYLGKNYAGAKYDWSLVGQWSLAKRLTPSMAVGPARVDPSLFGYPSVGNAWWILMLADGLVLYASEKRLAEAAGIALTSVTAAMAVKLIREEYEKARNRPGGGKLPTPKPVPGYAYTEETTVQPNAIEWLIAQICNAGLCDIKIPPSVWVIAGGGIGLYILGGGAGGVFGLQKRY